MKTILETTPLEKLRKTPILFDANIFMVGIEERLSNSDYSFERMSEIIIRPILECFSEILIHEEVYKELDEKTGELLSQYLERNIRIVSEDGLYGRDPVYTTLFNDIAMHELVQYERGKSKDRGEVFSLAYAAHHGINYFCSKEIMVDIVAKELSSLESVGVVTFDIILLNAYVFYANQNEKKYNKAIKSMYKRFCDDVIKRHSLPTTWNEYVKANMDYI